MKTSSIVYKRTYSILYTTVNKNLMIKIRKELEDSNNTGWDFKQVMMDIIQKKTSIKYHEVYIYRLLHKWGFSPKVPQKRFVRTTASQKEKKNFKKEYKRH